MRPMLFCLVFLFGLFPVLGAASEPAKDSCHWVYADDNPEKIAFLDLKPEQEFDAVVEIPGTSSSDRQFISGRAFRVDVSDEVSVLAVKADGIWHLIDPTQTSVSIFKTQIISEDFVNPNQTIIGVDEAVARDLIVQLWAERDAEAWLKELGEPKLRRQNTSKAVMVSRAVLLVSVIPFFMERYGTIIQGTPPDPEGVLFNVLPGLMTGFFAAGAVDSLLARSYMSLLYSSTATATLMNYLDPAMAETFNGETALGSVLVLGGLRVLEDIYERLWKKPKQENESVDEQ